MALTHPVKINFLDKAAKIAEAAAQAGPLGAHSGEFLAKVIEATYNKMVELAEKAQKD
jgi:hypothetical protein